ncbi:LIM domain-binding protein 2-like [Styela clava]
MPIRPGVPQRPRMEGPVRSPSYMPPDYKIYLLNKRLQEASEECDNQWWDALAHEFFDDKATLTVSLFMDDGPKQYTIGRTLIPRYFRSIYDGGATQLYFVLQHAKDMFNPAIHAITMDCDRATMVTHHMKPVPTKICTEGHLVLEFSYDDLMRIRMWHFEIHNHSELIPKQVMLQEPAMLEKLSTSITKQGMSSSTINYLKLCVILEPMKEVMSRQKTYNIDPRDCLRNCLFQKWQRMMNPPEPMRGGKRPSRKRKNSSNTNSGNQLVASKKKNFPSDVMVVGEPSLMGGEFGDEDERMITRLENQFEPGTGPGTGPGGPVKTEQETGMASFPHTTSPAMRPGSNMSPWQTQLQTTPQQNTNGAPLSNSMHPNSGPPSQNPSENNGQDTMPSTPISGPS